jgi:hypothetical protein
MTEQTSMRQVKEVLRLRFGPRRARCEIAVADGLSKASAGDYLARSERAGRDWRQAKVEATPTNSGVPISRCLAAIANRFTNSTN